MESTEGESSEVGEREGGVNSQWRKPNSEESARGFVAICSVVESIRQYNPHEKAVGRVPYLRQYHYTEAMLVRRASRNEDLPQWWKPQEEDKDAAWMHYIETGEASKDVQERLKTLGSYRSAA